MKLETFAAAAIVTLVAGLGVTETSAQERVAFAEVQRLIKPGETLQVRGADGKAVTGKVVSISGSEIVIAQPRAFRAPQERTFQAASINRIARADSVLEGTFLGLGVGLGAAGAIAATNEWNPDYGAPGAFMVYGVLLGSVGAGVGMAIDSAIKPVLYEASKPGTSVRIAPMVRGGRKGILATIRF